MPNEENKNEQVVLPVIGTEVPAEPKELSIEVIDNALKQAKESSDKIDTFVKELQDHFSRAQNNKIAVQSQIAALTEVRSKILELTPKK